MPAAGRVHQGTSAGPVPPGTSRPSRTAPYGSRFRGSYLSSLRLAGLLASPDAGPLPAR
jgi:hypothetical protein